MEGEGKPTLIKEAIEDSARANGSEKSSVRVPGLRKQGGESDDSVSESDIEGKSLR
jgi:hypothetical protein